MGNDLDMMVGLLLDLIKKTIENIGQTNIFCDSIAAPKDGNPALAVELAKKFCKPLRFVNNLAPLNTEIVEGKVEEGEQIIVIHDIVTSGERIGHCIRELRKLGGKVNHAFTLIQRTDRRKQNLFIPLEYLKKMNVTLHSLRDIDDHDLQLLLKKA